jgi:hypothetical protein
MMTAPVGVRCLESNVDGLPAAVERYVVRRHPKRLRASGFVIATPGADPGGNACTVKFTKACPWNPWGSIAVSCTVRGPVPVKTKSGLHSVGFAGAADGVGTENCQ